MCQICFWYSIPYCNSAIFSRLLIGYALAPYVEGLSGCNTAHNNNNNNKNNNNTVIIIIIIIIINVLLYLPLASDYKVLVGSSI